LAQSLPAEHGHVPVYLDQKLFAQRMACEQKHMGHANANNKGVGDYAERFDGGNTPAVKTKKPKIG
jgi:hypothetical protein